MKYTKAEREKDRELTLEQIKQKYFPDEPKPGDYERKHLLYLAKCEDHYRNSESYSKISEEFKQNNIRRIKHYIELRTEAEKQMPEYQIFIDSMEKSLEMLSR